MPESQPPNDAFFRERSLLLHTLGEVCAQIDTAAYRFTDEGDVVEVHAGLHTPIETNGEVYDGFGLYVVAFSGIKGALYEVQSMAIGGAFRLPASRSADDITKLSKRRDAARQADRDYDIRRAIEHTTFSQPLAQRHLDWFVDDVPENFNRRVKNWQLLLS